MRRRPTAAAVLVTAAALLAGCSSSGEQAAPAPAHHVGASHTPGPSPTSAAPSAVPSASDSARSEATPDEEGHTATSAPQPDDAPADTRPSGPTVPEAELTPATGSFDKKQKEYLVGRVPEGTDPAAVLVAGQATCERITRTAKVDRKAAVDAIRSGEIGGAKAAITHLCPQHRDLLRAAGR